MIVGLTLKAKLNDIYMNPNLMTIIQPDVPIAVKLLWFGFSKGEGKMFFKKKIEKKEKNHGLDNHKRSY